MTNAGVGNRTILVEGHEDAAGTKPGGFINNDQFRSKVTGLAPDIVTIDLGDKDATPWNWGQLSMNFEKDYCDIINAIKESNPAVKIYICIPPYNKNHVNAAGHKAVAEKIYAVLTEDNSMGGIENVTSSAGCDTTKATVLYDLNGRVITKDNAQSGLYIVKTTYADGKIKVNKAILR